MNNQCQNCKYFIQGGCTDNFSQFFMKDVKPTHTCGCFEQKTEVEIPLDQKTFKRKRKRPRIKA